MIGVHAPEFGFEKGRENVENAVLDLKVTYPIAIDSNREIWQAFNTDSGIVNKSSSHSVDQTVEKLKGISQAKGVALFALIDHSGEAEKVGMKMKPTKLLIFGNPKAGTTLMLAAPSNAIDLPLKILVWEDAERFGCPTTARSTFRGDTACPKTCWEIIAVVKTWQSAAAR